MEFISGLQWYEIVLLIVLSPAIVVSVVFMGMLMLSLMLFAPIGLIIDAFKGDL